MRIVPYEARQSNNAAANLFPGYFALMARHFALPKRIHAVLLGGGHMVDSAVVHTRTLAARAKAFSASL
jgi:hypothetical protein